MTGSGRQKEILDQVNKNPTERHDPLLLPGMLLSSIEATPDFTCDHAQVIRRLGLGTHAEVYEVISDTNAHVPFAMKVEKPIKQATGYLLKEIDILKALSGSRSVPKYLGAFSVEIGGIDCLACGMEQFEDSLSSLKHGRKDMPEEQRSHLLDWLTLELFECIFQIHDAGFLHRDIKPSNFLFKQDLSGRPRIVAVDFGSSVPIGERNDSPFRGTGAYAGIALDSLQSKPEDDYWSVLFSIMELSFDGGLPWRAISARSEEGRTELTKQKIDLLDSLVSGGNSSDHPLLSRLPATMTELTLSLYAAKSDSGSLHEFRKSIERLRGSMIFDDEVIFNLLRPPFRQFPRPLSTAGAFLQDGLRALIIESVPFGGSVMVSCDDCDPRVLRALSTVASTSAAGQPSFEEKPICVSELLTGLCRERHRCPLFHIPFKGIQLSAMTRVMRTGLICAQSCFGKCADRNCNRVHVTSEVLSSLYRDGQLPPVGPKSKRPRNS